MITIGRTRHHRLPTPPTDDGPDPRAACVLLERWGFLANSDLPDQAGPGYLLVALRPEPTLRHYDPESVEFWESRDGRGVRRTLKRTDPMPLATTFAWGPITVVDRLGVDNEWLTFGGALRADSIDGAVFASFVSSAPLLRRGGHSQGWDAGAENLGAFFGRMMVAVDYAPGFECAAAAATPLARYGTFLAELQSRFARSPGLRATDPRLWHLIDHAADGLKRDHPDEWSAGLTLLRASGLDETGPPPCSCYREGDRHEDTRRV